MNRHIRLADCEHLPTPDHDKYSWSIMHQARVALVKRGLRYDNATGKLRDNTGLLEEYVKPNDHVPHATLEDVMRWEFRRQIANSASRLSRGYSA